MLVAHSHPDGKDMQSLFDHSRNVAALCEEGCAIAGLGKLGRLAGSLHDQGKGAANVQRRIRGETDQRFDHSAAGMRWLMEAVQGKPSSAYLAAQMAALAIGCHHSGRCDVVSPLGEETWKSRLHPEGCHAEEQYAESVKAFFSEVASEAEVMALIDGAAAEVKALHMNLKRLFPDRAQREFARGFVQRLLFGALVDADWTDTACFADGIPLPKRPDSAARSARWAELAARGEAHIVSLPEKHPIDALRRELSERCRDAGRGASPGIYRLCLPTGAGKTYAGLRFCLQAAQGINARHIFYFAPYKSITGQNAQRIREALGDDCVLEHHSDFIADTDTGQGIYLARSSRWEGAPVICSTMVQLLDTLFAAPRRNARRLPALAGSVLLFDEVQALPLRHTYLFNFAVNTLAELLGCVVVLCTATQPKLEALAHPLMLSASSDIIPDYPALFERLRRIECNTDGCKGGGMSTIELATFVSAISDEHRSTLVVLNTRMSAIKLHAELKGRLDGNVKLFCLTTRLCPAHRKALIKRLEALLNDKSARVVCVSTQLIEAGVDLDFDCAVRSLAGLVNAVQTGGRCHRHGGGGLGTLYLVDLQDEDLSKLPEIDEAKKACLDLLSLLPAGVDCLSPEALDRYYKLLYSTRFSRDEMMYNTESAKGISVSLVDLLSVNEKGSKALAGEHNRTLRDFELRQAFGTAEGVFEAIEDGGTGVLVPYGKGKELIAGLLSGSPSAGVFRELEAYTVQLRQGELERLGSAVYAALDGAVHILQENYYDSDGTGVVFDPLPLGNMFA